MVLRYVTWACLGCSQGDENFLEERSLSQVKGRVQEGLPGGGGARRQTGWELVRVSLSLLCLAGQPLAGAPWRLNEVFIQMAVGESRKQRS